VVLFRPPLVAGAGGRVKAAGAAVFYRGRKITRAAISGQRIALLSNYFFAAGTEKDHFNVEGWPGLQAGPGMTP
jgi:hypothetical protein